VSEPSQRSFSTDFKVRLVQRVEAGERVSALVAETGVLRKSIYEWRASYRALGIAGLNRKAKSGLDAGRRLVRSFVLPGRRFVLAAAPRR
jgi:transposase-like protein